jgi:hypothetical protein
MGGIMNLGVPNDSANVLSMLATKLRDFGLNPRDWRIVPQGHDRFKVEYTDDETWYFLGTVKEKENETTWERLHLASL